MTDRDLTRLLVLGTVRGEKRRMSRQLGDERTLEDKALEVLAGKGHVVLRMRDASGAWLVGDEALLRLGERAMERLLNTDRGRWGGERTVVWESVVLSEAALAICSAREERGHVPPERAGRLRASIEAYSRVARGEPA